MNNKHLVHHPSLISQAQRAAANGHKAAVVWFTGLPGSGKSTIAHETERRLFELGCQTYVLDGDNIRHGLSADLGFSPEDRNEHLRRIAELSLLVYQAGMIVLCAFVSPTQASRDRVRTLIPQGAFLEIYCQCPVEVCAARDQKGFYAKAQAGQIRDYTGVSAPYEAPVAPELRLDTATMVVKDCVDAVLGLLRARGMIPAVHASAQSASAQSRTAS